ncbi:TRAP-like protein (TREP) [Balamuthia mandrillaris]
MQKNFHVSNLLLLPIISRLIYNFAYIILKQSSQRFGHLKGMCLSSSHTRRATAGLEQGSFDACPGLDEELGEEDDEEEVSKEEVSKEVVKEVSEEVDKKVVGKCLKKEGTIHAGMLKEPAGE